MDVSSFLERLAEKGHLPLLHYLDQRYPTHTWSSRILDGAVIGGHSEVIRWLRRDKNCAWSTNAFAMAITVFPKTFSFSNF